MSYIDLSLYMYMIISHRSFADTVKSTLLITSPPCPQPQTNPNARHNQNKSKNSAHKRKTEGTLAGNSAEDLENCGADNHVNPQEGLEQVTPGGPYDFVSLSDGGDAEKTTAKADEYIRNQVDDINEEMKQNFLNLKQHLDNEYKNPHVNHTGSENGLSEGSDNLLEQIDLLLTPNSVQNDDSERERDIDIDRDDKVHKRMISVNYQEVARLLPTKDLDFDVNDELLALGSPSFYSYIYIYI